jgi:hypothetical protein
VETGKTRRRQLDAARRFMLGVAAVVVATVLAACSSDSASTSRPAEVPLQAGKQTTLAIDATGYTAMAVDAKNVLYLGGIGISTLAPGAAQLAPFKAQW